MKKLQNSFDTFLPQTYFNFRRDLHNLNSNQAVVAELLRICCEENNVKAIQIAFERMIGKPERPVIIKRTTVRTLFPDARKKAVLPVESTFEEPTAAVAITERDDTIVVAADNAPGQLLTKYLDHIGEQPRDYSSEVLENKDKHTVAEVIIANLYTIAMRGSNLAAITMLFDYLDGAVADVIRIDDQDIVIVESYADTAPYEAVKDDDGIYYVDLEAIR